jgi:hypothetical protein
MGKKVANAPDQTGRSKLAFQAGFTHAKQGKGDPTGAGGNEQSPHFSGSRFVFRPPPATGADRFRGTKGDGLLRCSGDAGAHQIGKRK